jgi:hypothetical protein
MTPKVKAFLAVVTGMAALIFIRFIVHDHDNLFVAAEAAHAIGIPVLIYKLTKEKTCAGMCQPPSASYSRLHLARSVCECTSGLGLFFRNFVKRFRDSDLLRLPEVSCVTLTSDELIYYHDVLLHLAVKKSHYAVPSEPIF